MTRSTAELMHGGDPEVELSGIQGDDPARRALTE